MANENHIQLPADDSNGKRVRVLATNLGSGYNVFMETPIVLWGSGNITDTATPLPVQIRPSVAPGLYGKAWISATSVSGGVSLTSAPVKSVRVKAQHHNSGAIYVGSNITTSARPYSGVGYILRPDEYVDVDIDQAGKVFVFGEVSGYCHVTYAGNV